MDSGSFILKATFFFNCVKLKENKPFRIPGTTS